MLLLTLLVYQSVFDKYGYTRQEFENTILYYVHNNMDTLHSICERTVNKFNLEKEIFIKTMRHFAANYIFDGQNLIKTHL